MLILALDTTTRSGSLAIVRDGRLLDLVEGDPARTHATRLPGAILDSLARHHLTLADLELYGVAAGPGSFTGLRIGLATVQGLAFAHGRPVVGVSALEALVEAAGKPDAAGAGLRAAWMDAQRGEVYGQLYRQTGAAWQALGPPVVDKPPDMLAAWFGAAPGEVVEFVGDGAVAFRAELDEALGAKARVFDTVPPLAPAIAAIAAREAEAGRSGPPGAVRPLYVRRPDAELARERRRRESA